MRLVGQSCFCAEPDGGPHVHLITMLPFRGRQGPVANLVLYSPQSLTFPTQFFSFMTPHFRGFESDVR